MSERFIRAKGESAVDVREDFGKKRKRKKEELPQDVDDEVSRPAKKNRAALSDTDTNRRVTRSMTKAKLNARSSGDGLDTTQTEPVRDRREGSRRKRMANNRRK